MCGFLAFVERKLGGIAGFQLHDLKDISPSPPPFYLDFTKLFNHRGFFAVRLHLYLNRDILRSFTIHTITCTIHQMASVFGSRIPYWGTPIRGWCSLCSTSTNGCISYKGCKQVSLIATRSPTLPFDEGRHANALGNTSHIGIPQNSAKAQNRSPLILYQSEAKDVVLSQSQGKRCTLLAWRNHQSCTLSSAKWCSGLPQVICYAGKRRK